MPFLVQDLPPSNPTRLLAPVQQRAEAELVRLAIETIHPGALRYLSKGSLNDKGKELMREANYAGDSATWYRAVSRYLAALKCDHTKAEWSEKVQKYREENPTHFPFRIRLLGKRALITHATKESGIEVGDELVEIEGRHVDDVRRQIGNWTAIDGRTEHAKLPKFGDDSDLMGSGLDNFGPIFWGLRPLYKFRFRKAGAKQLTGIKFEEWKALDPKPDFKDAVTFTRPAGRVAVLRIDSFINYRDGKDPIELLKPHFEALRRDPGVRLVLDLRRCSGGSDEVPVALLRYLCPQPITWASEVWKKAAEIPESLKPYLTTYDPTLKNPDPKKFEARPDGTVRYLSDATKPQEPLPEHFDGPLDVLVGPTNASGATLFLTRLRASRPVRMIGEPTGGSVEGPNGGSMWFLRLPHSGFTVRIPVYRTETGVKGKGMGIEPDIRMRPTESDVLGKTDTVLDWALANPVVVKEKPPATAGSL